MKIKGNTILITGGATGIGFSLAESLLKAGNKVIICGRRADKLKEAKQKLPQLETRVCNVNDAKERQDLFLWIKANFPTFNVLINNAGIQKMIDLKKGIKALTAGENEIETNLVAPIHLCAYFMPILLKAKEPVIINVSSGLGFAPIAAMPLYCATKAALHSFTLSLRHQLKNTGIKVFEIVPPSVDTELGSVPGETEKAAHRGIPPSELSEAVLTSLSKDEYEIAVGEAKGLVEGSRTDPETTFQQLNNW